MQVQTRKKVCIVAECMYCGGVEKSLLSLLECIDREKYEIRLMLLQKKGDLLSFLPNDIKVEEIPLPEKERADVLIGRRQAWKNCLKEKRYADYISKGLREVRICYKASAEEKRMRFFQSLDKSVQELDGEYDIAIDYMGYGLFNTFFTANKVKAKKKITWVHFDPIIGMEDFKSFQPLLDKFDKIVCVSNQIKSQLIDLIPEYTEKCTVFYNIVNYEYIHNQAHDGIGFEGSFTGKRILSIGRLDEQKGFDLAMPAFQKLLVEQPELRWYIIGEGPQRMLLEQIIKERKLKGKVILLGRKTNPYPYLAQCDYYFQPSRHEGYGIAVAEARAFAKPMVTTDFDGAKEQLKDGETGIIVKCEEDALYAGLKVLVFNEQIAQRLHENLCKEQIHSMDGNVDGLLND